MKKNAMNKELNICILKESLKIGGNERSAVNVSRALEKQFNTYFAVYDAKQIQYNYGGKLINLNCPAKKNLFLKVVNSFVRLYKFKQEINAYNIRIVYQFISINNFMSYLSNKHIIKIISARDFAKIKKDTKRFKNILNGSDALICNSDYIKKYYLACYPEDKEKLFTLYNIIDYKQIRNQSNENINNDYSRFLSRHKKNIVAVGRFCNEKGFEYLIKAYGLIKDKCDGIGLVMVGSGELEDDYKKIGEELGVSEDIYYTGYQKNPYKFMKHCDIFVLSSLSEGFPNVLVEAMALGLPVVSTNCYSGPAEILMNTYNYDIEIDGFYKADYGLLVPRYIEERMDDNVINIANAIHYLLNNSDVANGYAISAQKRAQEFSEDIIMNKLKKIISVLVCRRKLND